MSISVIRQRLPWRPVRASISVSHTLMTDWCGVDYLLRRCMIKVIFKLYCNQNFLANTYLSMRRQIQGNRWLNWSIYIHVCYNRTRIVVHFAKSPVLHAVYTCLIDWEGTLLLSWNVFLLFGVKYITFNMVPKSSDIIYHTMLVFLVQVSGSALFLGEIDTYEVRYVWLKLWFKYSIFIFTPLTCLNRCTSWWPRR